MKHLNLTALALAATLACGDSKPDTNTEANPPAADAANTEAEKPATAEAATTSAAGDLLHDPKQATETAPAEYTVKLTTTKGDVLVDVHRDWAPKGADRFYNLVKAGFYDDTAFFRIVPGFVAQIGISGDPTVAAAWREASIEDDPVTQSNKRGTVTFATAGPNTRTTQIFINLADNANLDQMGFAPFGVVRDMGPIDSLNQAYGERANQRALQMQGNAYLKSKFPDMDYIQKATIEPAAGAAPAGAVPTGAAPTGTTPEAAPPAGTPAPGTAPH